MNITELKSFSGREVELIEKAAKRAGMVSLMNHGAASCVYSEGCAGVTQEHLMAFAREIALHCATALYQPHLEDAQGEIRALRATEAGLRERVKELKDAQGEIRALRATEAGLRERVKELEEVAAALLPFADDASAINGYGYYRPKNPHDFHPDAESCTEDEIAAHKAACEAWDAGTYKDNYGDGWVSPNVHILRAPWGIGSYTDEVPEIAAICNRARALLEKKK